MAIHSESQRLAGRPARNGFALAHTRSASRLVGGSVAGAPGASSEALLGDDLGCPLVGEASAMIGISAAVGVPVRPEINKIPTKQSWYF